jgi:glycosyltransferase involved in cell wall biosynthesis
MGLPIEFAVGVSYDKLCELYSRATIYWHAAGYGIDEKKNPELTEHFGISTVEAISAQALPLVVPRGGQREIIQNHALTWDSIPELVEKTVELAHNRALRSNLLHELSAEPYTEAHFRQNLAELLV